MSGWRDTARRALAPGCLLALALALRLKNVWTDLDALSMTTIPDDTFYYFGIAKHLVLGHPPSIDGVHATNGYHPLWLGAVLVPIYAIAGADELRTPAHVALSAGAAIDVVAAWLLWRVLGALRVAPLPRLALLALYAVNPYGIALATSGLETPLALALELGVFLWFLKRTPWRGRGDTVTRSALVFGVLAGLAVLARTDASILAGTLAAAGVLAAWRADRADRTGRGPPGVGAPVGTQHAVRFYGTALAVAFLVTCPWWAYSFSTTGTVVQSSSLALAILLDRFPAVWGIEEPTLLLRLERTGEAVLEGARIVGRLSGLSAPGALAAFVGATAVLVGVSGPEGRRTRLKMARARPLLVALAVAFVAHTVGRKVFREWYSPPFLVGLWVLLALALDHLWRVARTRRVVLGVVALVAAGVTAVETHRWQTEGLFAKAPYSRIRPNPTANEGHTDCGALGYFQGGVSNLDGVVNQGALEALRAGRMLEYVRSEGFTRVYATDHYHSPVFFGPGYREQVRRHSGDPRAIVPVDEKTKNELIRLDGELVLGSREGWELLGDGWLWYAVPDPNRPPMSLGQASEILFVPAEKTGADTVLELMLSTDLPTVPHEQTVTLRLNDGAGQTLEVGRAPRWFAVSSSKLVAGRNRIRLEYADPRPVRNVHLATWWRTLDGNPLAAILAHRIRLSRLPALPPAGPPLSAPASNAIFVDGWLPVERPPDGQAGVWATQEKVRVRFAWRGGPDRARLTLAAGPPPPDDQGQTISLRLNGRPLGKRDLPPSMVESFGIDVPAGVLRRGPNWLELAFARLSPSTDGDVRRAAFVRSITLE